MTPAAVYADFSIKARCSDLASVERILSSLSPIYLGEDNQTDTYFQTPIGRLKLREGNIERLLTHYIREEDQSGRMKTTVYLYVRNPSAEQVHHHTAHLPQVGRVTKRRKIYFIDNVKFHLDRLSDGQTFVEIEAIDANGQLGLDVIRQQADNYKKVLGISERDILKDSYIDMAR